MDPKGDFDKDSIPNGKDRCPLHPETVNQVDDTDGCPDFDTDGDNMIGKADQCPNQGEDFDQFEDEDGCPDLDNDGDGVPDTLDQCADGVETVNGFRDNDGCPDSDEDGDGIDDREDKCADKAETKNGYQDDDGCPDELPKQVARFSGTIKGIVFKRGSATIAARSFKLLDKASAVLAKYDSVRMVIEGHTDNTGSAEKNRQLSLARASAVREYLISHGVDESRLTVQGYGPDRPVADNKKASGRAKNRRVEFTIVHD